MRKRPAITLIRGNRPIRKAVGRKSTCWGCRNDMAKNDPVFEVPDKTKKTPPEKYYRANKHSFNMWH